METNLRQLRRTIMLRVWYSFTLSIVSSGIFLQGLALGASLMIFRELVFVERVITSFLARPVGETPQFLAEVLRNAVTNGEFLTLLTLGIIIMTTLTFGWRLLHVRFVPHLVSSPLARSVS